MGRDVCDARQGPPAVIRRRHEWDAALSNMGERARTLSVQVVCLIASVNDTLPVPLHCRRARVYGQAGGQLVGAQGRIATL